MDIWGRDLAAAATLAIDATGGTFALTFAQTSGWTDVAGGIAYNATAANIKTAIDATTHVTGNAEVTGSGGSFTLAISAQLSVLGSIAISANASGLTGGGHSATVTPLLPSAAYILPNGNFVRPPKGLTLEFADVTLQSAGSYSGVRAECWGFPNTAQPVVTYGTMSISGSIDGTYKFDPPSCAGWGLCAADRICVESSFPQFNGNKEIGITVTLVPGKTVDEDKIVVDVFALGGHNCFNFGGSIWCRYDSVICSFGPPCAQISYLDSRAFPDEFSYSLVTSGWAGATVETFQAYAVHNAIFHGEGLVCDLLANWPTLTVSNTFTSSDSLWNVGAGDRLVLGYGGTATLVLDHCNFTEADEPAAPGDLCPILCPDVMIGVLCVFFHDAAGTEHIYSFSGSGGTQYDQVDPAEAAGYIKCVFISNYESYWEMKIVDGGDYAVLRTPLWRHPSAPISAGWALFEDGGLDVNPASVISRTRPGADCTVYPCGDSSCTDDLCAIIDITGGTADNGVYCFEYVSPNAWNQVGGGGSITCVDEGGDGFYYMVVTNPVTGHSATFKGSKRQFIDGCPAVDPEISDWNAWELVDQDGWGGSIGSQGAITRKSTDPACRCRGCPDATSDPPTMVVSGTPGGNNDGNTGPLSYLGGNSWDASPTFPSGGITVSIDCTGGSWVASISTSDGMVNWSVPAYTTDTCPPSTGWVVTRNDLGGPDPTLTVSC